MNSALRWLAGVAVVAALIVVAGCGESPQVIVYKKGEYQGRQDTLPWGGEAFKGDRAAWETAIKARNQGQDEYTRLTTN